MIKRNYFLNTLSLLGIMPSFAFALGLDPVGELTYNPTDGYLYGTTQAGGTNGFGVVFKVDSNGNQQGIYSFGSAASDGHTPNGNLVYNSKDEYFYGTTSDGGAYNQGTVFKIDSNGNESVIYQFGSPNHSNDGAFPLSGLAYNPTDGYFYGTTDRGGASNKGTVFKIDSNGNESVIYSFRGNPDGANPVAKLTYNPIDGYFYGTTEVGGGYSGTVFKIDSNGNESVVYEFGSPNHPNDGVSPITGLVYNPTDGYFYGTTNNGGNTGYQYNTIYKVNSNGIESVIYRFYSNPSNGYLPYGELLYSPMDKSIYGTTEAGGPSNTGTVFKVDSTGAEHVIYNFGTNNPDGVYPQAGLIYNPKDGYFYGTTINGGTCGSGIVFKLAPNGKELVIYSFCNE